MRLILSPFCDKLTDKKPHGHFMQVKSTTHSANNYMNASDEVFGEGVVRIGASAITTSLRLLFVGHSERKNLGENSELFGRSSRKY
jgi:hypothetical protein